MSEFSFKLPDLGEGIVESEIVEWYVREGDGVNEEDHIADVMTDKALVEVTAPVTGTVLKLACAAGEVIAVGSELIRFQLNGVAPELKQTHQETVDTTVTKTVGQPQSPSTPTAPANHWASKPQTSPAIRKRARELDIDLQTLAGTGPKGRITREDLEAHIQTLQSSPEPVASTNSYPLKGLRRTIAQKMQQSKRHIPHYSYIEEVDMTALESLRVSLNQNGPPQGAAPINPVAKLTLLPFIIQALNNVLPNFPHCNAHYDEAQQQVTEFSQLHTGIATMTEKGLMVPVMKNCQNHNLWSLAQEIRRLSERARTQTLKASELSGSTLTITSLGALGGVATTPIINAPEVSIIGINKLQQRPIVQDGDIVIRMMMNISASFDHRVVDGYDGAQLVQAIKQQLEQPATLFMQGGAP